PRVPGDQLPAACVQLSCDGRCAITGSPPVAALCSQTGGAALAVDTAVRKQLANVLTWRDAHVGFDKAIEGIPVHARGKRPSGLPYSAWQLLEHMRIAQRDILDFCRNPDYEELNWPDDYWPHAPEPPTASAWDESVRQFREDRAAMQKIAT